MIQVAPVLLLIGLLLLTSCEPSSRKKPIVFTQDPATPPLASSPAVNQETNTTHIPVQAPTDGKVKFVSYNLWNYLTMRRGSAQAPKPEQQVEALIQVIAATQPDILGVCEIGTKQDLADLQTRLLHAGINLPHSAWTTGQDGDRNLGLLSAYPIVANHSPTNLRYQLRHNDGQLVSTGIERGILDITLQLAPDYQLRLLGIHFKSQNPSNHADQAEMRLNEAILTRAHVDQILKQSPQTNLLVYGDFNDTTANQPLKVIRGPHSSRDPLALIDLELADNNGDRWTHFWARQDIYSRLDFLFYNNALEPELIPPESGIHTASRLLEASDHRPLYTTIITQEQ